ncbi:MAG TPA: sigma-70 family RNA polymerase sigma factor [Thermoanaerobaculia bacterium]|nr:sigma-70 family RNA polymerase sigma factor [Thermoanaerobaculia bacterium]
MLSTIRDRLFRQDSRRARFEQAVLPHLDAAWDLARWLTRNDHDAEDVVQTATLRALQFFDGFKGESPRAWLLAIVRNAFYTWLQQRDRGHEIAAPFDEEVHAAESTLPDPEAELLRQADSRLLRSGFESLPLPYREVMVLRELEGLSYKEIAAIAGIPIGTVMSRLARARRHLQDFLIAHGVKEGRR